MAKLDITSVNTSDTFQLWLNKTNELVELMNSEVLTASPVGDITIGNATLTGTFTTTDLISTNIVAGSLSAASITNNLDPVNFVAFNSPVSVTSTQEKLLVLKSSSQKPAMNLVNAANANWNVTLGTITATSPFIIETEGTLNPQFTLNQTGDLILSGKLTATSITATLTGNASTATKFAAPVNINGVAFDGSAPISINTINTLSRAVTNSYLLGDSFNGSTARTWSVDAASANTPSKVVVRDAVGDFSAGTITATLVGNATSLTNMTTTITELNYVDGVTSSIQTQLGTKAPLASPALTGTPTAPTANAGASSTQIATTAFVASAVSTGITGADAPTKAGVGATGTWGISISGNAATATTAGSADSVTNGVYIVGNQTIAGIKSFSSAISVPNSGNTTGAATGINLNASGSGYIFGTTGDGATSTIANVKITSWNGIGFSPSIAGQPTPQWQNAIWMDVRSGDIACRGNVSAYASDVRLKTNFKTIESPIEKLSQIGGYEFDWDMEKCLSLGFKPNNVHEHGLKAQEIQMIVPDAISIAPFDDDGDKNSRSGENYLTVNYERIVPLLIEAIKELKNEIELLKRK